MHENFTRMYNERVFKYSYIFYHMFMYYQPDRIPFPLQKLDTKCRPKSIIFWTPLFHNFESPYTYLDFIDSFDRLMMTMLKGSPPPKVSGEIKMVLQFSKQSKVGDWYLYQNHTEIRIYGCELAQYKLPKYIPMRLFSREYSRKTRNYDEIKFVSAMKISQFKLKN